MLLTSKTHSRAGRGKALAFRSGMTGHRRASVALIAVIVAAIAALWIARGHQASASTERRRHRGRSPLSARMREKSRRPSAQRRSRAPRCGGARRCRSARPTSPGIPRSSDSLLLQVQVHRARRHDAEVRLRARERRRDSHQVRQGPRDSGRSRGHAAAARARFGADDITLVERLRCYGCPEEPFSTMKAVELTRAEPLYKRVDRLRRLRGLRMGRARTQVRRAGPSKPPTSEGWAFFELDTGRCRARRRAARARRRPAAAGRASSRTGTTSRRTSGWCACPKHGPSARRARRPFLMLQDVGAHVRAEQSRSRGLGAGRRSGTIARTCTISMRDCPTTAPPSARRASPKPAGSSSAALLRAALRSPA